MDTRALDIRVAWGVTKVLAALHLKDLLEKERDPDEPLFGAYDLGRDMCLAGRGEADCPPMFRGEDLEGFWLQGYQQTQEYLERPLDDLDDLVFFDAPLGDDI